MRPGGGVRSENVGISNKNGGKNPPHRKPKVSWATQIDPGLVGPKARLKSVADGQLVNIPALSLILFVVDALVTLERVLITRVVATPRKMGGDGRASRKTNSILT